MRPVRNHSPSGELDENSSDGNILRRTRRRLQGRFENQYAYQQTSSERAPRRTFALGSAWTGAWAGMPAPRIPTRVLRSGANTLARTLNSVQTTFGSLSQKFRRSTKRRQQLKNEPSYSPVTPQSKSRYILGRTPTKLYSPFGIETPCRRLKDKENEQSIGRTPKDRNCHQRKLFDCTKGNYNSAQMIFNETVVEKNFDPDMEEVRIGIWELRQVAHRIVKRSSVPH